MCVRAAHVGLEGWPRHVSWRQRLPAATCMQQVMPRCTAACQAGSTQPAGSRVCGEEGCRRCTQAGGTRTHLFFALRPLTCIDLGGASSIMHAPCEPASRTGVAIVLLVATAAWCNAATLLHLLCLSSRSPGGDARHRGVLGVAGWCPSIVSLGRCWPRFMSWVAARGLQQAPVTWLCCWWCWALATPHRGGGAAVRGNRGMLVWLTMHGMPGLSSCTGLHVSYPRCRHAAVRPGCLGRCAHWRTAAGGTGCMAPLLLPSTAFCLHALVQVGALGGCCCGRQVCMACQSWSMQGHGPVTHRSPMPGKWHSMGCGLEQRPLIRAPVALVVLPSQLFVCG